MKKTAWIIILILILSISYYLIIPGDTSQLSEIEFKIVKAELGEIQIKIESTGSIEPEREIEIKCEASGEIAKLPVEVSNIVKKGVLLVQLDPKDEKRLVKRAEVNSVVSKAKLEQSKISLKISKQELENEENRLKAELESARIIIQGTESKLKRITHLYKKKMASEEQLEEVQTNHAKTEANLKSIEISILNLEKKRLEITMQKHDISIAEQQVQENIIDLEDAEERLKETTVLSPIDGVVSTCDVQVGQIISSGKTSVNGGTTVLFLADMSRMYVFVQVDESDIGRINNDQSVKITVDAFPDKTFNGTVVRVATKGKSFSNVITYEVKVEIEVPKDFQLKLGMTANVEILIVDKKNILRVPAEAIHQTTKNCYVMVAQEGKDAEKREIKIGESDSDWTEILSGLNEGDKLVVKEKIKTQWRKSNDDEKRGQPGMPQNMMNGGGGEGPRR